MIKKNFLNFHGRASRKELLSIFFLSLGLHVFCSLLFFILNLFYVPAINYFFPDRDRSVDVVYGIIYLGILLVEQLISILVIWTTFFMPAQVRRLHDLGLSGWYMVLILCIDWSLYLIIGPFFGFLVFFVLLIVPGEKKTNLYGVDPAP